jgi:hypothetical protein
VSCVVDRGRAGVAVDVAFWMGMSGGKGVTVGVGLGKDSGVEGAGAMVAWGGNEAGEVAPVGAGVVDECVTLLGAMSSGSLDTLACFFFFSTANTPNISNPSSSLSESKKSESKSVISTM